MIETILSILLFCSVILNIILLSNINELKDKIERLEFDNKLWQMCDSHD